MEGRTTRLLCALVVCAAGWLQHQSMHDGRGACNVPRLGDTSGKPRHAAPRRAAPLHMAMHCRVAPVLRLRRAAQVRVAHTAITAAASSLALGWIARAAFAPVRSPRAQWDFGDVPGPFAVGLAVVRRGTGKNGLGNSAVGGSRRGCCKL